MQKPKLRDGKNVVQSDPYPLNEIPPSIVRGIGGYMAYLFYIGRKDVKGEDWGDAFADAVGGTHLDSPIGIADVVLGNRCWSMKTVKATTPFNIKSVRLISGRCSPDYSYGITDPHKDIQRTGDAVLGIWNERVNIAHDHYNQVRTSVLVRSDDFRSYVLFEEDAVRFRTSDYTWSVNKNGNLVGKDYEGRHRFTWQPHGSQFTIITEVPPHATRFMLKIPDVKLYKSEILEVLKFDDSWVTILD